MKVQYKLAGDCGIMVEFENTISPEVNARVRHMAGMIQKSGLRCIREVVPAYRSLLVLFNPLVMPGEQLVEKLKTLEHDMEVTEAAIPRLVEIPTLYGGEYGPDIEFVARHNNLTVAEVIKIHSGREYLVYMLGFSPGFPYLGGMSEKIAAPRLDNPRTSIPAGSVGIAGIQTGIYPVESPGGWQLIGRSPLKFFNPESETPFLLKAGDLLKFVSITEEEFYRIREQEEQGICRTGTAEV